MSVTLENRADELPPSRVCEASVALTLALVAVLVWGVVLPIQIVAALG